MSIVSSGPLFFTFYSDQEEAFKASSQVKATFISHLAIEGVHALKD